MTLKLTLPDERQIDLAQPLVIGRDPGAGLRMDHPAINARHVELYRAGDLWWARDLGSAEGTFLDGEIVDASPLAEAMELRLGESGPRLRLEPGGTADANETAA